MPGRCFEAPFGLLFGDLPEGFHHGVALGVGHCARGVKHGNEGREELTKEEIFQSVAGEIKTSEMKLEQRKQMRNTLQHDAREALEKVCGKKAETKEVQHMTLEGMQKELKENTKHQMEYVNSLKQNTMNSRA